MTVTLAFPGRPTTWGSTVIQSSTFSPVDSDFSQQTWEQAQTHVRRAKMVFRMFPRSKDVDPSWNFLMRTDQTGINTVQRTLIGINIVMLEASESAINVTDMVRYTFPTRSYEITCHRWAYSTRTLTNLAAITKVQHESASMTLEASPEDLGSLLLPTEMWENLEETISFLQKRNAAGVPTYEPVLRALAGLNPLG